MLKEYLTKIKESSSGVIYYLSGGKDPGFVFHVKSKSERQTEKYKSDYLK